jgi:hypothetical protein
LSAHLSVEQKVLQQASAATQQWNEFLKGLVVGYNSCAITDQQYADSLKRIYPRLREDAAGLGEIRKVVSEGLKADEKGLQSLLDIFCQFTPVCLEQWYHNDLLSASPQS